MQCHQVERFTLALFYFFLFFIFLLRIDSGVACVCSRVFTPVTGASVIECLAVDCGSGLCHVA